MLKTMETTPEFATPELNQQALDNLKAGLKGQLILPDDKAYETARKVWNAQVDKHPALIVRLADPSDVVKAVRFARKFDLPLSVRGGGHNPSGIAIADKGLVIDLSRMRKITVDPENRVARAEGGATWGELDRATQEYGLAATGTDISTVGIGGSTLGGGHGWLGRAIGLAIDNVKSVELVTADGRFLKVNEKHYPDLFWAVRGAGSNLGVVTAIEYKLHPVGPTVVGGIVIHPMSKAKEVLEFYREFTAAAPKEITTVAMLASSPEGELVIMIGVCYAGDIETGLKVVEPIKKFGQPLVDMIGSMPYLQVQTDLDAHAPFGQHSYWKAGLLNEMTDGFIETVAENFAKMSSAHSIGILWHAGGAISEVAPEATAYNHRNAQYHLRIIAAWVDPAEAEKNIEWGQDTFQAVRPYFEGMVYVNHLDKDDKDEARVREAYGENYDRLVALKNKYDPTNVFSSNFNIRPTV